MTEYKFKFEKKGKKGRCPACLKDGVFRYYEGYHGHAKFGKCERVNNCDYQCQPDQDEPTISNKEPEIPAIQQTLYLDAEECVKQTLNQTSNLHKSLLASGITPEHLIKWGLGTNEKNGDTIYFYQEETGKYLNKKAGPYQPNGKRVKDKDFYSMRQPIDTTKKYRMCLFGKHLLSDDKNKIVCMVESEKTAIIASFYYPQFDWVACGSANGLTDEKLEGLIARHIYWLCDADKAGRINSSIKRIKEYCRKHDVIDLFKHRVDGYDVADAILDGQRPEIEPDETEISGADYIPEAAKTDDYDPKDDLEEYGFFKSGNRYYKQVKKGNTWENVPFTNFTMRILFHIDNGLKPRRIVELVNVRKKKKVLDVETTSLTSIGKFKEFIEGAGNYLFEGDQNSFNKLKLKLYDDERSCEQIELLGHNEKIGWAWANGIFNYNESKFIASDENGIADVEKQTYYIAYGNKVYDNQAQKFSNEKRFKHHIEKEISFEKWSKLFCSVYGDYGMVTQLFGISCLFSDYIFKVKNFFPMVFLYGEGSSGKGSLARSVMYLFGVPQDPLTLTGKANTDKAKIRNLANFVNACMCLEEYSASAGADTDQMLKNLWDRFGYRRSTFDGSYRTESVPVNSGVIITGNEYPVNDPLIQRLILMDVNKNEFSQEEKDNYTKLRNMEDEGITSVTLEILKYRDSFKRQFSTEFVVAQKEISKLFVGYNVTERMINNNAVILAVFKILKDVLKFQYTYDDLMNYLKQVAQKQNEKRNSGGEVQRWWDIFLYLVNDGRVKNGKEFKLDGDKITVRYKEVHTHYMVAHSQIYKTSGLLAGTLLDKLKAHKCYSDSTASTRFGTEKSSGTVFKYSETGIDIINSINYTEAQEKARIERYSGKQEAQPVSDGTAQQFMPLEPDQPM